MTIKYIIEPLMRYIKHIAYLKYITQLINRPVLRKVKCAFVRAKTKGDWNC